MIKKQIKYNTNLAAEFYVLSMLYRKGLNAHLTLGNKKSVDIYVEGDKGKSLSIDVKGIKGKDDWPMDNFKMKAKNHFFVLVSFHNNIEDHLSIPECWIVPSEKIEKFFYNNPKGNRQVARRGYLIKEGSKYLNNWKLLNN